MRKEVLMENRYLIHALTNHALEDEVKIRVEIQTEDEHGNTVVLTTINADIDSVSNGGWPVVIKASAHAKLRIEQEV